MVNTAQQTGPENHPSTAGAESGAALASRGSRSPAAKEKAAPGAPADEGAGPALAPPRRLSPSALNSYKRCPKQFWFKHVAKAVAREKPSPVFAQSGAIHEALAKWFGLPLSDRSVETLHRALRAVWPKHREPGAFHSREEEAGYGQAALVMLTTFAESFATDARPLAREQWASVRLPTGVELFGRVDRIDPAPQGEALQVIDYKTGERPLDSEDLPADLAVQVYLLAVEAEAGRPVELVRYLYLPLGPAGEVRWEPEREDVEAVRERLMALTAEILEAKGFPARPGPHCRWCPFALRCPDRDRVSLADLEPGEEVPF